MRNIVMMERKNLPMAAGAVTCVITFIRGYTILKKLAALLITLVVFYVLGTLIKWTLDEFDRRNAESNIVPEEEILEEEEEEVEEE